MFACMYVNACTWLGSLQSSTDVAILRTCAGVACLLPFSPSRFLLLLPLCCGYFCLCLALLFFLFKFFFVGFLLLVLFSYMLLSAFMLHCLSLFSLSYSYGVMSLAQIEQHRSLNPDLPKTRQLLAIPFVGKDTPSHASEFSHPDVVIGLTILSFRYQGLRFFDFLCVLQDQQDQLEGGQYHGGVISQRPPFQEYVQWVEAAGGFVRGTRRRVPRETKWICEFLSRKTTGRVRRCTSQRDCLSSRKLTEGERTRRSGEKDAKGLDGLPGGPREERQHGGCGCYSSSSTSTSTSTTSAESTFYDEDEDAEDGQIRRERTAEEDVEVGGRCGDMEGSGCGRGSGGGKEKRLLAHRFSQRMKESFRSKGFGRRGKCLSTATACPPTGKFRESGGEQEQKEMENWSSCSAGSVYSDEEDELERRREEEMASRENRGEGASSAGCAPSLLAHHEYPPDVDLHGGLTVTRDLDAMMFSKIWPLDLLDLHDREHVDCLYRLLWREPLVIASYLFRIVFPSTLEYATQQLSASGQEIGGDILFPIRLGFSGTPSNLLPIEMGKCFFEGGTDGKMIKLLTNPNILSFEILPDGWSVDLLLDLVARGWGGEQGYEWEGGEEEEVDEERGGQGGGSARSRRSGLGTFSSSPAGIRSSSRRGGGAGHSGDVVAAQTSAETLSPLHVLHQRANGGKEEEEGRRRSKGESRGRGRCRSRGVGVRSTAKRPLALIDTGALITGKSNYEVAVELFSRGLPDEIEGVVFLDEEDRQMVLMREDMRVVQFAQCGLDPEKRFTFYDHVHTTGQVSYSEISTATCAGQAQREEAL